MAIIDKTQTVALTTAYMSLGESTHFIQADGQRINGYVMKKAELMKLLEVGKDNHLYVMLGLKTDDDPDIGTYITPFVGKVENNKIDPNSLVIAEKPNTSPLGINPVPSSPIGVGAGGAGYPITTQDAQRMIDYHLIAELPLVLENENNQKIRTYNLNPDDVKFLVDNDPPESNADLVIMPALRDQNYDGTGIAKNQLTLIFAWLMDGDVQINSLYDYVKPCPSDCLIF